MKTNQEFLAGMWNKVNTLEVEEIRKQIARERNQKDTMRMIAWYSFGTLAMFMLLIVSFISGFLVSLILVFLFFCLGYAAESFLDNCSEQWYDREAK